MDIALITDTTAQRIDVADHRVTATSAGGSEHVVTYDQLVVATGVVPARPPIGGLDHLGPDEGVHLLHTMGDTFDVLASLETRGVASVVIVGAGYIGLEMAEALTARAWPSPTSRSSPRSSPPWTLNSEHSSATSRALMA